jgi:NAD(P)-dependent dehydrogenase (short-subunit alcohol dehydrogenase family)
VPDGPSQAYIGHISSCNTAERLQRLTTRIYQSALTNRDFFESENGKALIRRVPQRRLGQLHELDGPLLLLLSEAGSFMTGSVVVVDGGHLVSGL